MVSCSTCIYKVHINSCEYTYTHIHLKKKTLKYPSNYSTTKEQQQQNTTHRCFIFLKENGLFLIYKPELKRLIQSYISKAVLY